MSRSFALCASVFLSAASPWLGTSLELRRTVEFAPEVGQVVIYIAEEKAARFSFSAPLNWNVKFDSELGAIKLAPQDLKAWITIKISEGKPANAAEMRRRAEAAFPAVQIGDGIKCYTAFGEGESFEFLDMSSDGVALKRQLAYVPFAGGTIEFLLSSRPEDFSVQQNALGQLLTSFKLAEK